MNPYSLKARYFPTILAIIPLFIIQYFILNDSISGLLNFLSGMKFLGNVGLSAILLYLGVQFTRLISKKFFESEEKDMPTTTFLLFSDTEYSKEFKRKIYKQIETDFGIILPSENEQSLGNEDIRKRISEGVSLIRRKVGKGTLLLQHNTEYGFWRNLIGGSVLGVFFSLVDIYLATNYLPNNTIQGISIIILIIYTGLLMFNKTILDFVGKRYAKILFQEYINK